MVLNGELAQRRNAFADNHPLGDFFAALPGLAIRRPIPDRIQRDVDRLQDEVRRVRFDLPDGFAAITFWPLGIDGARRWPFVGRIDRMLVISPFLSPRLLSRLAKDGDKHVLVSRLESLEALDDPAALGQFERVFFMNPSADAPNEIDEETNAGGERSLSGLHAKLYVADAGWDARVWVGSANATERAFGANVEFLIELVGAKSRCGVDAVLGGDESVPFAGLLQLFEPGNQAPGAEPISEQLERHLELARRAVASAPLYLRVDPGDGPEQIRLGLFGRGAEAVNLPSDLDIRCWPITLKEDVAALSLSAGTGLLADFGLLSFEALTSFLAFEIAGTVDGVPGAVRFVLNLPIEGAPADRRDRILRSLLRDPDRVLRFLFLLLSEDEIEARDALFSGNGQGPGTKGLFGPEDGSALFEVLVSTLDRNPAKLDEVARLIDDLRKSPEGEALLPPGFNSVWQPIWTARQRLKDEYAGPTP
ncbi:MAG TPA: phospholipase D family protein [bacterium]|nr:phospholipase D family protein [bacterium]